VEDTTKCKTLAQLARSFSSDLDRTLLNINNISSIYATTAAVSVDHATEEQPDLLDPWRN